MKKRIKEFKKEWLAFYPNEKRPLKEVDFLLDTKLKQGLDWKFPEIRLTIDDIILNSFNKNGWNIIFPSDDEENIRGIRGKETIYFQPMKLNCEIRKTTIPEIKKIFKITSDTILFVKEIKIKEDVFSFEPPYDIIQFMHHNKKMITNWILEDFKIEKPLETAHENICEIFNPNAIIQKYIQIPDYLIREWLMELISEGKLIKTSNNKENYILYRTA